MGLHFAFGSRLLYVAYLGCADSIRDKMKYSFFYHHDFLINYQLTVTKKPQSTKLAILWGKFICKIIS